MSEQSPEPAVEPSVPAVSATEQTISPDSGDARSVLAQVREIRSHLGADATPLDLPVPGYENLVVLRCKWVPYERYAEQAASLESISKPAALQVAAAADLIALVTTEVLLNVNGELEQFPDANGSVNFSDPRLADLLGFPAVKSAREAVMAALKNDYAVLNTGNEVITWLQDTSKKIGLEQAKN